MKKIQYFLIVGMALLSQTAFGQIDIFEASRKGNIQRIQELVRQYPDTMHAQDYKGFTPLILAAYNGQAEAVEFLLKNGADADAQDVSGNTALMGISFKGHENIARLLLQYGVRPGIQQ